MTTEEFRKHAHAMVDWMADYLETVESRPVKSPVRPGEIMNKLPVLPPQEGEAFEKIFDDFTSIILPGMTHWQHPSFFAYFPANNSEPSILAEMLTATLGAQCMSWVTSPAATELEGRMMQWLGAMIGLPATFTGVIQDTASTATLCSVITAREVRSRFSVNMRGYPSYTRFTAYCSTEAHSSIEKAIRIAGIGKENLRKIEVDQSFAMRPEALDEAIKADVKAGMTPLLVVAAFGTTGSTAIDPLKAIGQICQRYKLWYHIDAAFAGSALLLPEIRTLADGIELADTFVFNPHKWLFTNFDCSAYFVKDRDALIKTFEILPEYLKTADAGKGNNYRDWGIQMGRRFRALKLWFVIRSYGVKGLRDAMTTHMQIARTLASTIAATPAFEVVAPVQFNTICFRIKPADVTDPAALDLLNEQLMNGLNSTGKLYLSHTRLNGRFTLRLVIGQTHVTEEHVDRAWALIKEHGRRLTV
jgi:aromatic-L-amino-acid/L-tryptophan decarboxylase